MESTWSWQGGVVLQLMTLKKLRTWWHHFKCLDFPMGRTYAKHWLCPLSFQKYEPVRSALKAQHSDWECGHELGIWRQMWGLNHEFWSCATPLTHPWEPFESCRAWGKWTLCLSGSSSPKTLPCACLVWILGRLQKGHMTGRARFSFGLWRVFFFPHSVCKKSVFRRL